jgi:FMN-dependent NADH-azoreductase
MKLLRIDSSILSRASVSRQISGAIVSAIVAASTEGQIAVKKRDLASLNLSHINGAYLAALTAPEPPVKFEDDVELGQTLLKEFMDAEIVVIGSPMYNFTVSSQLKAWLDRIVIANKTFRYTSTGPVGLAGGKRIIAALARGGHYAPGAVSAPLDFQKPYLQAIFGFMGIDDVTFVEIDGLTISPESKANAIQGALEQVRALQLA